jgi:hypothetical protein
VVRGPLALTLSWPGFCFCLPGSSGVLLAHKGEGSFSPIGLELHWSVHIHPPQKSTPWSLLLACLGWAGLGLAGLGRCLPLENQSFFFDPTSQDGGQRTRVVARSGMFFRENIFCFVSFKSAPVSFVCPEAQVGKRGALKRSWRALPGGHRGGAAFRPGAGTAGLPETSQESFPKGSRRNSLFLFFFTFLPDSNAHGGHPVHPPGPLGWVGGAPAGPGRKWVGQGRPQCGQGGVKLPSPPLALEKKGISTVAASLSRPAARDP